MPRTNFAHCIVLFLALSTYDFHVLGPISTLANPLPQAGTNTLGNGPPIVNLGYAVYQGVVVPASPSPTPPLPSSTPSPSNSPPRPQTSPSIPLINTQFLSIRYAAPPLGQLRFSAPRPPIPIPGVQQANSMPDRCWAGAIGTATELRNNNGTVGIAEALEKRQVAPPPGPPFNEDCLYLNVHVPGQLGEKKNLPVIFWIHGGGYVSGSASGIFGDDVYNGNDLIREAGGNVVVVVVQYRLGLYGFLAGKKVKAGGALNAGLLDQQFALQWIQQHISKFGGNPKKVTIWGESAGAGSVLQHVVANGGKTTPPLFRGAITSSTYLPPQYKYDDPLVEGLYAQAVSLTGCASSRDTLQCLRQANITSLQSANEAITLGVFFGTFAFSPVVDGSFITDRPTQLLKQGKLNGQGLYAVTNTLEGWLFVDTPNGATIDVPTYLRRLFPRLTNQEIAIGVSLYAPVGSNVDQAVAIMGESIFICPSYFALRSFQAKGIPGFKGEFAIVPAWHGFDVAYYFTNGAPPAFSDPTFVKSFSQSFGNFVLSLDPNTKWDPSNTTPPWSKWLTTRPVEMFFGSTTSGTPDIRQVPTSPDVVRRCDFWDSVSHATAQ